jgi:predicted SPOUT superfamily RNA methylase MTH1
MTTLTLQVGIMPGRLSTVAVEAGSSIKEILGHAGIEDYAGYEIKADGVVKSLEDSLTSGTTVLLTKKVKGNANVITLQVGVMPGRLQTIAIEGGQTVSEVLSLAGIEDYTGYEIKLDGAVKGEADAITSGTTLLLTKKVKGNVHTVQIGIMPGRLTTLAVEPATTYSQAFALADIDATGYEVKADGNVITNFDAVVGQPTTILLTKKVKGN